MEKNDYVSALESKLVDLQKKIADKRAEVQDIFVVIGQLQKQADHIHELLKAEGSNWLVKFFVKFNKLL